jgi:hypothetical protein
LAHLEAGLEAIELVQGNRKYRGRVWCGDKKRTGCREVPFIYQHAHINCINHLNTGIGSAIKWPLGGIVKWVLGPGLITEKNELL